MNTLTGLRFENSYARLPAPFFQAVDPTPLPNPYLVAFNPDAARVLDLDPAVASDPQLPFWLGGHLRLPGSEPIAQAYAGHQFGVWVPELGDGRAFLLGEVVNARGESWDLHLKGAGRTRFSRFGDGRSVLRSAVREYLACEALHGLGIPTTRALAIVGSDLPVQRERVETAATLLRLSPCHVRFGTFEYFAARGEIERLRELAGYVLRRHYPALTDRSLLGARHSALGRRAVGRLFEQICTSTARLIAHWMAAGFAHGVLNTDNFSVLGITLDFGPYGFMDEYDAGFVSNHSDTEGRYRFDRQPAIGLGNCARLGDALLIVDAEATDRGGAALDEWQAALETYWPAFSTEYARLMRAKLGLTTEREDDAELVRDLLGMLQEASADYTGFFRKLCEFKTGSPATERRAAEPPSRRAVWFNRYTARLRAEGSLDFERRERMRRVNPKFVLRNWIAQEVILAAEQKEFGAIEEIRRVLAHPFDEHCGCERYAAPPTAEAREIVVSCSS
ncbi:MAG: protein adenylyltransferase SelO [Gemmatimonadales bacterium]